MNVTQRDILDLFQPVRTAPGGERYFSLDDAARVIDAADRAGLAVIGLDIFNWDGTHVQPVEWHDLSPNDAGIDWPGFRASTNKSMRERLRVVPHPESKLATLVIVSRHELE